MRLLLDINVVLNAVCSRTGAFAELLRRVHPGEARMLASVPLFADYEAILMRQEHRDAAGLNASDVETILDALAEFFAARAARANLPAFDKIMAFDEVMRRPRGVEPPQGDSF